MRFAGNFGNLLAKISDLLIPASQIPKSEVARTRLRETDHLDGAIATMRAKLGQWG
jgi:hypothetical protein